MKFDKPKIYYLKKKERKLKDKQGKQKWMESDTLTTQ